MRELLYIPTGTIVRFKNFSNHVVIPFEQRVNEINISEYDLLLAVACGNMSSSFYKLNGIPQNALESEYEIIEVA